MPTCSSLNIDELRARLVRAAATYDDTLYDAIDGAARLARECGGVPEDLHGEVSRFIESLVYRYVMGIGPGVADTKRSHTEMRRKLLRATQHFEEALAHCLELEDEFVCDAVLREMHISALFDSGRHSQTIGQALSGAHNASRLEARALVQQECDALRSQISRAKRLLSRYPAYRCPSQRSAVTEISNNIHYFWNWLNLAMCARGGLSRSISRNSPMVAFAAVTYDFLGRRGGDRAYVDRLKKANQNWTYRWPATGVASMPYPAVTCGDVVRQAIEGSPEIQELVVVAHQRWKFFRADERF